MPNSATFFAFVEIATKCLAITIGSLALESNQFLADSAFIMVSWVLNTLDAMMKRVVSGDKDFNTSTILV